MAALHDMDRFSRAGLVFDVDDTGPPDGEVVMCLHGFPESRAAWEGVAPGLAAAGRRVLAPDQRGYSPGARPLRRGAYRMAELVADVVALADRAGAARFHVVGHDWGGAVAWALGAWHPDRVATLTVLSTPHPQALLRSFLTSTQGIRSWYMGWFQVPAVPERVLLADDVLGRSLRRSGLPGRFVDRYVARMREPGAATAALNWYRAAALDRRAVGAVRVPTLYAWSTGDVALGRAAAEATAGHVSAPYRFEVLDGVSHWIPEEAPEAVVRLVLSLVA